MSNVNIFKRLYRAAISKSHGTANTSTPHDDGMYSDGRSRDGAFKELKADAKGFYQAYKLVIWIRRCVDLRASCIASVPLCLFQIKSKSGITKMAGRRHIKKILTARRQGVTKIEKKLMGKMEPVTEHPVLDLLSDVNPFSMNQSDLWRDTEKNIGIFGEAFWYLEGLGSLAPREIYLLPNKCVTVHAGKTPSEFISHYEYKPNENSNPIDYDPAQIIHFRLSDPDQPFLGLSPQASTMNSVNAFLAANRWNYVYFKNAVKLSGFVELPERESVDTEDIALIREQINAIHQGIENQANVGVLSGGAKWVELLRESAKDSDFRGMQQDNREVFCASHGTPVFLVSSHDSAHFATADKAEEAFWTDTLIPHMRWFEEVLFWNLLPLFPGSENMLLKFDLSEVPALERINASKAERIQKSTGIPTMLPNEGREKLGLSNLGPDGDQLFGPMNIQPLFISEVADEPMPPQKKESPDKRTKRSIDPTS